MSQHPSPNPPRPDFARHARETVAAGQHVHLWVAGMPQSAFEPHSLRIYDVGGVPHIVCRAANPVARALGRRARLVVRTAAGDDDTGGADPSHTVIIDGVIGPAGQYSPLASGMVTVIVEPETVVVEQQATTGPLVTAVVPVATYLGTDTDPIAIHLRTVQRHVNTAHRVDLRRCAARLGGLSDCEIVSARLAELTLSGIQLEWIDITGAHRAQLPFAEDADDPAALDQQLHHCLTEGKPAAVDRSQAPPQGPVRR